MRSQGSAEELERRRRLAVRRVKEGYPEQKVAAFLGVHPRTVSRWVCAARAGGAQAIKARPTPGRPRTPTAHQEQTVLSWLTPVAHGLRFAQRGAVDQPVAGCLDRAAPWGALQLELSLVAWLTQRGHSAQKPAKKARERDEPAIARWVREEDWPRLQKKREKKTLISF